MRKLVILVLVVMIPLSSSAYYNDGTSEWSSRIDENGDEWNAYVYNLEWGVKDYTLTVKKRPDKFINNEAYTYKDEDGTYGWSIADFGYENEMLDYQGYFNMATPSQEEVDGESVNSAVGAMGLLSFAVTPFAIAPAGLWAWLAHGIHWWLMPALHPIYSKFIVGGVVVEILALIMVIAMDIINFVVADYPRVLDADGDICGGAQNGGYNLHYKNAPWQLLGIQDDIKQVVVEEGIRVGTMAFADLSNLRTIIFKGNNYISPLATEECNKLSYVYMGEGCSYGGGAFHTEFPRITRYITNNDLGSSGSMLATTPYRKSVPGSYTAWDGICIPFFEMGGLYAKSHDGVKNDDEAMHETMWSDEPVDRSFALLNINDYKIPLGLKQPKSEHKISRLRPAQLDAGIEYKFLEGTENRPHMPWNPSGDEIVPHTVRSTIDQSKLAKGNNGELGASAIVTQNQWMALTGNRAIVADGQHPTVNKHKILLYQEAGTNILGDDAIAEISGLKDNPYFKKHNYLYADYGFHTTVNVTAYDDDSYRENNIPTGTVEVLNSDENLFKIHNLNANGKTVITTAAQQDSLQRTDRCDTLTFYADANGKIPRYNLHFTSKATKVTFNGSDHTYFDGKMSRRGYGEDFTVRPGTVFTDGNGFLRYAKEGEIIYDNILVEANWGVHWTYIIKTVLYSKNIDLKSLSIDKLPLYPSFRKNIYEYEVYSDKDSFDGIKANTSIDNPFSTNIVHKIDGKVYTVTVNNRFTGESSKYTIKLNYTVPSISKLSVNGTPVELIKNKLDYEIKVDALNTNTPVTFEPAENSQVVDEGWNITEIANGRLIYEITVKTPTHEQATYSIVLFKEPTVTNDIKYEVSTSGDRWIDYPITIKVVPEKKSVIVIGNGEYTLKYKTNIYTVKLIDGDIKGEVIVEVKANYRCYDGTKMTSRTTADGTTVITLLDNILTAGDWHTDYFNITKKLVIYCNRYAIKAKIPKNSAQIIELKDAAVLPEDFTGNCNNLQEIHLYQLPWQIDAEVFSNPAKMRIKTLQEFVSKYKDFPVWSNIGEILSFGDSDDSGNSDNTGGTPVQQDLYEVKSFDIYLHSPEYLIMSVSPEENMTVELPSVIRQIDIRTQLEGNAAISIEGPEKLKVGDNRYTITVGSSVYGLTVRSVDYSAIGKVGEADSPVEFFDVTGNVLHPGRYYNGIVITKQGAIVSKRYVNGILN